MRTDNIRPKPSLPYFLQHIQFLYTLFDGTAQGIYPYIFVPKHIYNNLKSAKPDLYHVSLIIHEQTHLNRQKKYGWLKWMASYVFNNKFRFEEEMEANKMQMKFMKKHKLKFPFEKKARLLSSWVYLRPVNYTTALSRLKVNWNNA